ncbi:BnaC04g31300D [Brassica napus]|nr:BnaC04g31300D [Brassica napus]
MRILKTQRSSRGGRRNIKKQGSRRSHVSGDKFTEKLQALKSLLPPSETNKTDHNRHVEEKPNSGETEQLFQETADYIVRLRNQVIVLQKLIEIYGSSSSSDQTEDFVL